MIGTLYEHMCSYMYIHIYNAHVNHIMHIQCTCKSHDAHTKHVEIVLVKRSNAIFTI